MSDSATPWTVAHQSPLSTEFPGKNTRVGSHFLLQGIFLTQELNPGPLHCRQILYQLSYEGSPKDPEVGCHALLQGNFPTHVSHIAGRLFTSWATWEAKIPYTGLIFTECFNWFLLKSYNHSQPTFETDKKVQLQYESWFIYTNKEDESKTRKKYVNFSHS